MKHLELIETTMMDANMEVVDITRASTAVADYHNYREAFHLYEDNLVLTEEVDHLSERAELTSLEDLVQTMRVLDPEYPPLGSPSRTLDSLPGSRRFTVESVTR